jgi:cytochrome P450
MSLIGRPDGTIHPEVLADPYPLYARLRAESPVLFDRGLNGWLVSRYADVRALALDERVLARRSQSYFSALTPEERTRYPVFLGIRDAMVFYLDGPRHARIRRAVARALHRSVGELGPALVARHAATLVAGIARSGGEADLVRDLAEPLPRLVLADVIGLPAGDAPRVYERSLAYSAAMGGVIRTSVVEAAEAAASELRPRLLALAAEAASGSALAPLRDAGEAGDLSEDELVAAVMALVTAGHETTTNLIANALLALARAPDMQALARSSAAATSRVVDEVLRFDAPVQMTAREAGEDLDVGGEVIPGGDRVVLLFGSAGRDPEAFSRPDAFDPDRSDRSAALSFGVGSHQCLGSRLARMQAETAIGVLLDAVGRIELRREPPRKASFTFRGPAALEVGFASRG